MSRLVLGLSVVNLAVRDCLASSCFPGDFRHIPSRCFQFASIPRLVSFFFSGSSWPYGPNCVCLMFRFFARESTQVTPNWWFGLVNGNPNPNHQLGKAEARAQDFEPSSGFNLGLEVELGVKILRLGVWKQITHLDAQTTNFNVACCPQVMGRFPFVKGSLRVQAPRKSSLRSVLL